MKKERRRGKTAFVPSVVFATAVAGVIPAVVACGSGGSGGTTPTVACGAYGCAVGCAGFSCGVADAAFGRDGDAAGDHTGDVLDAPADSPDATDAPDDARFGVADAAFGG